MSVGWKQGGCARLVLESEYLVQSHCVTLLGVRGHLLLQDLGHSFVSMHDRVHVRVVDPCWFLFSTASIVERGLRVPCMLAFMFNSICSKHLDRKLQTSMFLMSSSRHVKGGCQWVNPFT